MKKIIYYNGRIFTMEKSMPNAEAVAIRDGIIVRVGSTEEIMKLADDDTELFDLEGKTVVPGFCDSHMHMLPYGVSLSLVDLSGAECMDDLVRLGKEFLEKNPSIKWMQGRGWNTDGWKDTRIPDRRDLDKISEDVPIAFHRVCGHLISLNSKALEIMGIDRNTPPYPGGDIFKDDKGEPTGVIAEAAKELMYAAMPKYTAEDIRDFIKAAGKRVLSYGITTVHTDDFTELSAGEYPKVLEAYKLLEGDGEFPVRIYEQCLLVNKSLLEKFLDEGHHTNEGEARFRIGSLKILADGSLGGRTAYLNRPYEGSTDNYGIATMSQEELNDLVLTAQEGGLMSTMHCIGDGAMRMCLDAIENAELKCPRPDMRHSLVHCQITDPELLKRCYDLNVVAHVQPAFIDSDMHIAKECLGEEREKISYQWKTMMDLGMHVDFGSDCPVIECNVMEGIYCAVTRKDFKGYPDGGWLPDQKMSVEDAVYAYTMGGAYASYDEGRKGSIRKGKYADMAVLDTDIFSCDEDKIKDTKVLMTIIDGDIVYKR